MESELIKYIDNVNQKHPTLKFEYTYSRTRITFLDTKVYKNENGTLHTKALPKKRTYSEKSEVIKHLKDLICDAFIKRGYQSKILDHHFERAMNVDRKILLENKEKPSIVLSFNKILPNIKNVIDKHRHTLSHDQNLRKVFDKRPFIVYRRNTNLFQLI